MDPTVVQYIAKQSLDRHRLLTDIHSIIVQQDKTVSPTVEPMMGKEMIVYKAKGFIKYGLASVKNYMSLHIMPIYGSTVLFTKYKSLLHKANFQKGCINFSKADDMPLDIVKELLIDSSKIDLLKIRENYLMGKKSKGKAKTST
ncbi:MAG: DUF1801 domain-containing protein [Sediminibacterium sp.]|nr:DUF1801 domain-containing protein [Sediminibacterium sp.]MBX9779789.1 hypothetical protein [Chitinophagaceae bacterium]